MNKKEKAKELVDKFEYQDNYGICENSGIKGVDLETAKQCALIAVDEIMKSHERYTPKITNIADVSHTLDYWQEVKEEIKEL